MYTHLLRKGNFQFLWLAQISSTLAVQLYTIGVMFIIFDQTGSALQTAGVLVANTLPHVLLGSIAGTLVDRYPRQWVLIGVELMRAARCRVGSMPPGRRWPCLPSCHRGCCWQPWPIYCL